MTSQPQNLVFTNFRPIGRFGDAGQTASKPLTPLGQVLVEMGELSPADMLKALAMREREDARLGDILLANGMASEDAIYRGLARQYGCELADLRKEAPDVRLIDEIGAERCIHEGFVPWKRIGRRVVIATAHPERLQELLPSLPPEMVPPLLTIAPQSEIYGAVICARTDRLIERAESRVPPDESCRDWSAALAGRIALTLALVLAAGVITAPVTTFLCLCAIAFFALLCNTTLKIAATLATRFGHRRGSASFRSIRRIKGVTRLPVVSMLVPLYKETEIANTLVRRLNRLNYPRELLDIVLVVEQDDRQTQECLAAASLPSFMRCMNVPPSTLKTKPRALNYALDFCRGSIVGVYDAEDAPDPDQIFKIVKRFEAAPADVACLQGVLDFYNSKTNWLSRCFSIEYATWFRVILPGLEKLGLAVPLGGTTLFFRRDVLEKLGGWDAHNVTEDADLGIRLARHGYRTELIQTTTREEANCRPWRWVRQRSRWLKGYAITWAVHMRNPVRLWRDLGTWKFLGVQAVFLGTLLQFLLAPVLWTFWALPLGFGHPFTGELSQNAVIFLTVTFLCAEAVSLGVAAFATADREHRWLWPWIPTMQLYFPLATLAAFKAAWELVRRPFYWDKTAHGVTKARGALATRNPNQV